MPVVCNVSLSGRGRTFSETERLSLGSFSRCGRLTLCVNLQLGMVFLKHWSLLDSRPPVNTVVEVS